MKNVEVIQNDKKKRKKNKLRIIEWEKLTYQEKIILAFAFIGLMALITTVINIVNKPKSNIDYKNATGEKLYLSAISNDDREIYWILNDIVSTFINSYNLELDTISNTYKEKIVYSREDFYKVLSEEYKNKLNKKEYLNLSKEMLEKFIENGSYMKENDFFEGIGKLNSVDYSQNMYICKLKTVDSSKTSYIGIKIYPNTKNYNIFYLE